jgi:hypothetical protein
MKPATKLAFAFASVDTGWEGKQKGIRTVCTFAFSRALDLACESCGCRSPE